MSTTRTSNREQQLRLTGRIIGAYITPETARVMDELARKADTGSSPAFKGTAITLAREANTRLIADMKAGGASQDQVRSVIQVLASFGKNTIGLEVAPLFESVRTARNTARA